MLIFVVLVFVFVGMVIFFTIKNNVEYEPIKEQKNYIVNYRIYDSFNNEIPMSIELGSYETREDNLIKDFLINLNLKRGFIKDKTIYPREKILYITIIDFLEKKKL